MRWTALIILLFLFQLDTPAGAESRAEVFARAACSSGEPKGPVLTLLHDHREAVNSSTLYLESFYLEKEVSQGVDTGRVWQFLAGGDMPFHLRPWWSGGVLCGKDSNHAWVILVMSSESKSEIRLYLSGLQEDLLADLPDQAHWSTLEDSEPYARLEFRNPAAFCPPGAVNASWEGMVVSVSLADRQEGCLPYRFQFDPQTRRFFDLPKRNKRPLWTPVEAAKFGSFDAMHSYIVSAVELHASSGKCQSVREPAAESPMYSVRQREASKSIDFEVVNKATGTTILLSVTGEKAAWITSEIESLRILGDRLIFISCEAVGVYSLKTGQVERIFLGTQPRLSPDGKYIAYKSLTVGWSFPSERASVIGVYDIESGMNRFVFPEREKVKEKDKDAKWDSVKVGMVKEEDPAKRDYVRDLFWSPDGRRLIFFSKRAHHFMRDLQDVQDYLVVVDPIEARFVRQPIPKDLYMKPGAEVEEDRMLFTPEDVEWVKADQMRLKFPVDAWWVKEDVILHLPDVR